MATSDSIFRLGQKQDTLAGHVVWGMEAKPNLAAGRFR
jgi:hypothetical protein